MEETIEMLTNAIESEVLKAKNAPFSRTDIIVNKNTMLEIINRLRSNYPIALKEAGEITKKRDEIIAEAQDYANRVMDDAEAKAKALVADTEIVKKAQEQAAQIQAEAEDNYRKMDYEARSLAFSILDNSEKAMREGLATIKDRKRKLVEN